MSIGWLRAVVLISIFVESCVTARPNVENIKQLGNAEALVVGKVILVPPLGRAEQSLIYNRGRNIVYLINSDSSMKYNINRPEISDYEGAIVAKLGETFYVSSGKRPFYILTGRIIMDNVSVDNPNDPICAYLPANFLVKLKDDDKAMYIGTIKYHRDELFRITKTEIIDEYDKILPLVKIKFGEDVIMRKAMVIPVNAEK